MAKDARRQADMRQLVSAQEMYYGSTDDERYLALEQMPTAIGTFLNPVPQDPGGGTIVPCDRPNPAFVYCALDNTGPEDKQKFCYFARMEQNAKQPYFTASHGGNLKRSTPPKTLDECAQSN